MILDLFVLSNPRTLLELERRLIFVSCSIHGVSDLDLALGHISCCQKEFSWNASVRFALLRRFVCVPFPPSTSSLGPPSGNDRQIRGTSTPKSICAFKAHRVGGTNGLVQAFFSCESVEKNGNSKRLLMGRVQSSNRFEFPHKEAKRAHSFIRGSWKMYSKIWVPNVESEY